MLQVYGGVHYIQTTIHFNFNYYIIRYLKSKFCIFISLPTFKLENLTVGVRLMFLGFAEF